MKRSSILLLMCALACHRGGDRNVAVVGARPATAAAIAPGDCVEARRRAAEKPDLDVDVLPVPVKQVPKPFQRMPANVRAQVARDGASVQANVVIDTLGHPVMSTFEVIQSSNAWLSRNLRSILPRWTFSPAQLAGCKVARVYKFSATSKGRG